MAKMDRKLEAKLMRINMVKKGLCPDCGAPAHKLGQACKAKKPFASLAVKK